MSIFKKTNKKKQAGWPELRSRERSLGREAFAFPALSSEGHPLHDWSPASTLFPWRPRPTRAPTAPHSRPAAVTVFRLWLEAKGNGTLMFTCIPRRFR